MAMSQSLIVGLLIVVFGGCIAGRIIFALKFVDLVFHTRHLCTLGIIVIVVLLHLDEGLLIVFTDFLSTFCGSLFTCNLSALTVIVITVLLCLDEGILIILIISVCPCIVP